MKEILLSVLLIFLTLYIFAQNTAGRLFEYFPAPGQHINIDKIGTPRAAQNMVSNFSSLISLGSFGGYVVMGFENACINHPDNPYGIDFTIFGNAFTGSSEPGVVWVMQDENENGFPDDTWYEIAGSSHFFSGTKRNFSVKYFKTPERDVLWKDNRGITGQITGNEFNLQEYYPLPEYFPFYPKDSVTFFGTLLENKFVATNSQVIKLAAPSFGYADCRPPVQGVDLSLPDNPYTSENEGAGGDPIDISWATDSLGNYIDLDSIHFVKIVSAGLNDAGWLGEISTDVAWLEAVRLQPGISGKENLLVFQNHLSKIIAGDSIKPEAFYFEKGRKINTPVNIYSLDETVAKVGDSGFLVAKSMGEVQIRFSAHDETAFSSINVVVPESIRFITDFSSVYQGETIELVAEIFDNEQELVYLYPVFTSSNPLALKIMQAEGKFYLTAQQPGEYLLIASVDGFQVEKQVKVKIHEPQDKIKVLFSAKTSDENLFPLQWIETEMADLNYLVDNRQKNYSTLETMTLFHALASGLNKAGLSYKFRDDGAAGEKLYLYMVENDGFFQYGWGGKTSLQPYARAWIVRLNDKQFLNGFDDIFVSDGDTVVLYHVPDIINSWNYTRLLPFYSYDNSDGDAEVVVEQTSCRLIGGEISESGFVPLSGMAVFADKYYFTNDQGRVKIEINGEFPVIVSSGNDDLLITEQRTTNVTDVANVFRIYPNPAENYLFIYGNPCGNLQESRLKVKLYHSTGTLLLKKEFFSCPVNLNLSFLAPGMYHLVIVRGNQPEIHKFIKL